MGEISQFIAMPFDLTGGGLVAGEPFKCASPASERAIPIVYMGSLGI